MYEIYDALHPPTRSAGPGEWNGASGPAETRPETPDGKPSGAPNAPDGSPPVHARRVVVQAGSYGGHEFTTAAAGGDAVAVNGRHLTVALAPGPVPGSRSGRSGTPAPRRWRGRGDRRP